MFKTNVIQTILSMKIITQNLYPFIKPHYKQYTFPRLLNQRKNVTHPQQIAKSSRFAISTTCSNELSATLTEIPC